MRKEDRQADELAGLLDAVFRRTMQAHRPSPKERDIAFTRREIGVMIAVGETGALSMGELAERIGVSVTNLSQLVDRLVQKGLVVRVPSETDRRVVLVRLTPLGQSFERRGRRHRQEMAAAMLGALSGVEQEMFLGLMRKIGQLREGEST